MSTKIMLVGVEDPGMAFRKSLDLQERFLLSNTS